MKVVFTYFIVCISTQAFFSYRLIRFLQNYKQSNRVNNLHAVIHLNDDIDMLSTWKTLNLSKHNGTQLLIDLIHLGDKHIPMDSNLQDFSTDLTKMGYKKVPGCMASVFIRTICDDGDSRVLIDGKADSRVANGMLAVICKLCNGTSKDEILSINPSELSQQLGLKQLLPPGRMNGFINMLNLIKEEVRSTEIVNTHTTKHNTDIFNPQSMANRSDEVAVLLSGGVDSSVALKLLQLQGYKVRAYYLKIWLEDEIAHLNQCPWEEDLTYAQAVCDQLAVPFETISLQREYWNEVVQYTLHEARRGRTPNPDIMCNSRIKFGVFYDYIGQFHWKIATGHYAQIQKVRKSEGMGITSAGDIIYSTTTINATPLTMDSMDCIPIVHSMEEGEEEGEKDDSSSIFTLTMSPDKIKDQTYFLSNLRQDQLKKCLFPIGHLQKSEVRQLAHQYQLPTMNRPDSQGICFLGKLKFNDFIGHYLPDQPGVIMVYETNEVVGHHKGLWFHTIGQRKGLGPLLNNGMVHLGPWFVVKKDVTKNILYVTNDLNVVETPRRSFRIENTNWNFGICPFEELQKDQLFVKLRHGPSMVPCEINRINISNEDYIDVILNDRDQGIASGQFAAFYNQEGLCLGGGFVTDQTNSR